MLLLDDNLFNSINDIGLLSSNILEIAVGVAPIHRSVYLE